MTDSEALDAIAEILRNDTLAVQSEAYWEINKIVVETGRGY